MFNVNDYIMYGMMGVCQVVDITEEIISNKKRQYYVLNLVYQKNTIIKTPMDNNKVQMRKIISKEEAISLINDMPNSDVMWIDDDKDRKEKFNAMLKTCQCDNLIKLGKSIYCTDKDFKSKGKKMHKVDFEILKEAERLLYEEFATTLSIPIDEVSEYISSHIPQEDIN